MKRLQRAFALAALSLVLWAGSGDHAHAQASAWVDEEQVSVRLIAARDALGADGRVRAGLQFNLKPGWKVYWRSPGDAGYPPDLDLTGSDNVDAGPLVWPVPVRFSVLGLETLGYTDEVVLPFTVTAPDPERPARIAAEVRYLTCADICIPYDAKLTMTVPPGVGGPSRFAHTIGKFDSLVPRPPEAVRIDIARAWTEVSDKGLYIAARATSEIPFRALDLFVEGPAGLGYGAPTAAIGGGGHEAVLRVPVSGFEGAPTQAAQALNGTPVTLTVIDGKRAAEASLDLGPPRTFTPAVTAVSPPDALERPLLLMLAFAFLGGLILNLMPCVLPVLSIKLLSLVKHGASSAATVRASFLMSAAGIVTAFMVLAAGLIGLKAAGAGIGWGIQFQQPWFLIAMAILVTLFACNLWGFFEFRLPGRVADAAAGVGGGGGLSGHFAQGMFATLLATPCSAPFLGTAVGFALARGAGEIALIFAFLGLGLAAPYLLVAAVPRLATAMPRPGPWMAKLRFALGLALAATAVWLLSVIAGVAGIGQALFTGVVLVAIGVWLGPVLHRVPEIRKATPVVLLFATLATVTSAYVGGINAPMDPEKPGVSKIAWQTFDPVKLERLVAAGHLVFVDVTADWCITCQVNKRLVMEQGRVLELLNGPDVFAMQADWTRPDPEIAAYLAGFDRYGIPFNAVYGPRRRDGAVLPELLSESAVLEAFRDAAPESLASLFGN